VKNKRYTLAVRRLTDGDTASSVLAEFLGILDGLDLGVKAVYLDREFYDSKCLTLLQAHNHAYVMPIVRWGRTIKQKLSEGWSRMIHHSLTAKLDGHSWSVEFPVYIDCTYQNGQYDEHGVARHGYAADAPFIDTPRDARYHYAKRFGIEASYRLSEQSIATTSTQNPVVRLLYVVVSLLLQNVWRFLHWEYVATPRRGGASPLAMVVQGVHQHGPTGSVDGPRDASGCPRESTTGRPVYPVTFGRASLRCECRRCRVGGRPPPTATARLRFVHASLVETIRATAPTQNSGFRNS
jgi:IS4 transposase